MSEQLARLPELLTAHLQLTLLAILLGALLSVPAGVLVTRRRWLEPGVLGTASVLQTIPSLALLAVMVPTLAAVGAVSAAWIGVELRSIGFLPAIVALTLYSTLPMLRNTVTGIDGVDPAVVEAARAAGMTPRQRLLRVELPLAAPSLVAGLRTATVWVVGTATLSTPVGAPSLGDYIFSGLQTRNFRSVWIGCAAAALLALALDGLIRLLETGFRRRRRLAKLTASSLLAALYLYAGGTLLAPRRTAVEPIVVGAKTFTEQYILAEILARRITAATALPTRALGSLGSTVVFDALRTGDVDAYVDYSGTIWATVMQRDTGGLDRLQVLTEVGDYLERQHGIVLVGPLGFENAYALAMRADRAGELALRSISDLAAVAPQLAIGGDYEFFSRPEWAALEASYGLAFDERRSMDSSLMYEAVARREVDVISAFSTDGRIAAYDLVLLEDDRAVIPPYDAILLAGRRIRAMPQVMAALEPLVGSLSARRMREMNLAVDRDGRSPAEVAQGFLAPQGDN